MTRAALALVLALSACSGDPERPPATSSGGTSSSSSGGGSSSGGTLGDGGSSGTDGGSSSGNSGVAPGLRASIDNAATEFADGPKALIQSGGGGISLSGKDSFGNELRLTLTNTTANVAVGSYDCTGATGTAYGSIDYVVTGNVATWTALASGECTISVSSIDNKVGGSIVGGFSGKAQRAASTERLITKGQFRLTLE